ncbi:hypothetical protein ACWC3Y_25600 [Streptomyces sp. NPDC001296]
MPGNVTRFIRGLEAAQRAGTVEHVRRLCADSGPFSKAWTPQARTEAEQALEEARAWLTGHEAYWQRAFTDLAKAVTEKRAWDVRAQLQTATTLTRRGASASEQRVLATACAFVRQQDHLLAAGSGRIVRNPLPLPRRPSGAPSASAPSRRRHRSGGSGW